MAATSFMALLGGQASADVLIDLANLVELPGVAAPSEHPFTAAAAEALTVTLTDFQAPAAFASLQVAVTLDDALVGSGSVDALTHVATLPVPAAAGNYVIRVVGAPSASQGFGTFGVCVTRNSDPTPRPCLPAYSFSGNLQTPATASSNPASTLDTNFTASAAGVYTVTLTDDAFPAALSTVSALIFSGSTPVSGVIVPGTPTALSLAAGTYNLKVAALANAAPGAGLYGVRITDPTGAEVFSRSLPVGKLGASTLVVNPSAQPLTLKLTDLAYPAPLAGVGAAVTSGGSAALAKLTAAGTVSNFTAPAATLEVWQYGSAGANPGVSSLSLSGGAASLFVSNRVVNPGVAAGTSTFAFLVSLPSVGGYNLAVNDFQFPAALGTVNSTVAQNGVAIAQSGAGDFTAAAGLAVVLVTVQAPLSGNGIFGVTVKSTGTSPQVLLDQTQAVGAVFDSRVINLGTSGGYDVTLADRGFPANFQNLAIVVSRSSQVIGKIFGGGTFQINGTPGQYVISFLATPAASGYGLYAIRMASSAPTVTFTAGASAVTAGQPVQLTWTSQDATACTAGGSSAWTGNQTINGGAAVIISATVNLTLSCTGPGGTTVKSVAVTATPAPAKSGGGGSLESGWLAMLATLAIAAGIRRFRRPRSLV